MTTQKSIEFRTIAFPSDNLTIKALRQAHPDQIDTNPLPTFFTNRNRHDSAEDMLTDLLYSERSIAEMAFYRALGKSPPEPCDVEAFSEELTRLYIRYGIASGEHHAAQLIRDFESQATAQARGHTGRQA